MGTCATIKCLPVSGVTDFFVRRKLPLKTLTAAEPVILTV